MNVRAILDRIRAVFGEFTAGQKMVTALIVLALVIGAVLFRSWAAKPSYAPLFSNLAASDAAAITDKLNSLKEPYRLADGGSTILVPQKDVYQLRLDMAKANLPASSQSGFSLLDKGGITTSEFQQNVAYQQALESELAKTIEAINGVQSAIVNIVLPQTDVFTQDSSKPTASVLVTTQPSSTLTPEQVQAIVHLVASSVEGLNPADVTVADSQGHVLSAPGMDGQLSAASTLQDQQTAAYEQRVAQAVQNLLQPLVGPGHVVVQVNAALNFDTKSTTSETYLQPSPGTTPIPLSQSWSYETYSGTNQAATGILGPDNIAVPTPSPSPGTYQSQSATVDNAIGRVVEEVKTAPGSVERLSVAVLLDSAAAKNVNLTDVKNLVTSAAGVQTSRGDSVSVATMPFDTSQQAAEKKALAAAQKAQSMNKLVGYAKDAVIALIVLGIIFFFLRRAKKAAEVSPILSLAERVELEEARRRAALGGGDGAERKEIPSGQKPADRLEITTPLAAEIGELVERQPEEVAQLLRGWLADRRSS
ncbi:flagellar M-ring protein FliF [Acidothermus cellulolyticus 11B]|uniref:Flagellar M-ring protein n=1 Tax=Acidothermus cellulolyticus (strain ATCC 43068 / DSM 8971 / 11B) TaxID=351607 RepID=A0LT54_ACIC1|nr:flagellar basal-body MS-ring/collar protein FliF [Acidothermus cellulolyticus]ABK52614.1 flagellar M-ring protein FliF [Acidothermus cellulolyticus 11B]